MWSDLWAVVDESDRAQWDYAPLERVGPLRFGMSPQEATAAMEAWGYTFDAFPKAGVFGPFEQLRARFRAMSAPPRRGSTLRPTTSARRD